MLAHNTEKGEISELTSICLNIINYILIIGKLENIKLSKKK